MIVTLITKEKMFSLSLPQRASGRYWITDADEAGRPREVAVAEAVEGRWQLRGSPVLALLQGDGTESEAQDLEGDLQVVSARYRQGGQQVQLFIEPATEDRQQYDKYLVPDTCRIDIGRGGDNQLIFDNPYVSAHHACLVCQNGRWSATDTQSSNGTFVNEERIATRQLNPGDMVYVMGLKITVGSGFFALNCPDGRVRLNAPGVMPLPMQQVLPQRADYQPYPGRTRVSRPPRLYRTASEPELRVDPPPQRNDPPETPAALLIGPALTMAMTAVVMGLVAVYNLNAGTATMATTLPAIVMSLSMLCGTLLWPPLTRRHEKKQRARRESQRQSRYREYLDLVRGRIFAMGEEQRKVLLENCPSVEECAGYVEGRGGRLWERTGQHGDFLTVRLGIGEVPLAAKLQFPADRFVMEDDTLMKDVLRLAAEPRRVSNAPVTCSLLNAPVLGVAGEGAETFVQSLVLQLAALHSYDEVKLVFLAGGGEEWSFARLLSHTAGEDLRYYAGSETEAKALSSALERVLAERVEAEDWRKRRNSLPHYVVVAADIALAEKTGFFRRMLEDPSAVGFSCIALAASVEQLPKECSQVVRLGADQATLFDRKSTVTTHFQAEGTQRRDMAALAGILANLSIDSGKGNYTVPSVLTFLELYNAGKVEHLNALTRWKENNPVNSLQVPLGVEQDGETFCLDLHERAHGPHGLVAGMTGSGKSEFIITMILSMAVNYHPDEVAFILIDYKGGGLAGAFEDAEAGIRLPHLAGTITNLDGAAVYRSLVSIQSELRRRQAVFNRARQISGEGTVDIYKYQKLYRTGMVEEPVPHLFIISDEFAELKAQQPEFMAQLVSAARIGRSLGVHLILATQKPSGVVDDQIWSNSRFRICLKVQEKADSVEMLKRPDAAELRDTGRFYLQVGFNELFKMGQSAWCGAPYVPRDRCESKQDNRVAVIDTLGRVIAEAKSAEVQPAGGQSQVVTIVNYLSKLAGEEGACARQLWLPPIPEAICLRELAEKYHYTANPYALNPIVGEYDAPFNQSQGLLTLPLTAQGNALVYGMTGSGKTTMLNTLLWGLLSSYDAAALNVYVIDLGEETLKSFEDAPQVGDVLLSADREKIQNLFKMLGEELQRRRTLLASAEGDFAACCRDGGEAMPHILVMLRNYAAFYEQFEALDEQLIQITRDCAKYGIYFLITASSANAVRYRVAQNFSNILCLRLNDRSDYIGIFGSTDGVYPSALKGRGIFRAQRVFEFQTARCGEAAGPKELRAFSLDLAAKAASFAPPVPVLPARVTADFFREEIAPASVPVGVEKVSLQPACVDMERTVITMVLTKSLEELSPVAEGMAEQMSRLTGSVTVLDGAALVREPEDFAYQYLQSGFPGRIESLFTEMVWRNNSYKTAQKENAPLPEFEREYYVITGLSAILDSLDAEGQDKLRTLMEKARPEYGIRFLLCDSAKAMSAHSADGWYKTHITGSDGVWVGDGISEQYLMKPSKMSNSLYAEVPNHFGYLLRRGRPVLVKLIEGRRKEGEQ